MSEDDKDVDNTVIQVQLDDSLEGRLVTTKADVTKDVIYIFRQYKYVFVSYRHDLCLTKANDS